MNSGTITLNGYIEVPEHRLDAVREAMPAHISLTRQEPGCLVFRLEEDTGITGRFNVYEEFNSQSAFDAHQKRAAVTEWAEITKDIPRHYSISETA